MTQKMSTHELLELASLDALGLLNEEEREGFELAFNAAPPALQAQLRAEQARMASDDCLLPIVQPPVGLRARVLAAVREAVQSVSGRQVAGRIAPDILPGRGVSPIWRAAAIGCLAASIVFAFTTLQMKRDYESINTHLVAGALHDRFVNQFGAGFDRKLVNPVVRKVTFVAPAGSETNAGAVVLLNPQTGESDFLCINLPQIDGEYRLVLLDEQGNVAETILTFQPTTGRFQKEIKQGEPAEGLTLAVLSVGRGGAEPQPLLLAQMT